MAGKEDTKIRMKGGGDMTITDSKVFTDEREVGGIEARELLPCPFCGENVAHAETVDVVLGLIDEDIPTYWEDQVHYCVVCDVTMGGCGCTNGMDHETKEKAIAAWNRRV